MDFFIVRIETFVYSLIISSFRDKKDLVNIRVSKVDSRSYWRGPVYLLKPVLR